MSTYAIDSTAQALRATGIVEPVTEWLQDSVTGKRRPSDTQATNDAGVPLWHVEVSYVTEDWGRPSTTIAKVLVPAASQPTLSAFEVVPFHGLVVSVTPVKGGGIREAWSAAGIGDSVSSRSKSAA